MRRTVKEKQICDKLERKTNRSGDRNDLSK